MSDLIKSQPEYLYRFRSLEKVLDKAELEKQEIFFSPTEQLNDPVEGYLDLVWKGDEIVWKNLLKNYLLCIHRCHVLARLDHTLSDQDIGIFSSDNKLPTQLYKDKMSRIYQTFFEDNNFKKIYEVLAKFRRSVRRDELIFLLRSIHLKALSIISAEEGLSFTAISHPNDFLGKLLNAVESSKPEESVALDAGV
jgi:hypothetical protein